MEMIDRLNLSREERLAAFFKERDELQRTFLSEVKLGLSKDCLVLGQASTGLGKTRMLLNTASWLNETRLGSRPWILVPTVSVMSHFLREAKALGMPGCGFLLGRTQFVSVLRTKRALVPCVEAGVISAEEASAVSKWLESGVPLNDSTKELQQEGLKIGYLMEDLLSIAPSFPRLQAELSESDGEWEPGEIIRAELQEAARESQWSLCTHAMFACLYRGWSALNAKQTPPYSHLLIDEAHDFEDSLSSMYGVDLSLFSLRTALKLAKSDRLKELAPLADELMKALQKCEDGKTPEGDGLQMLQRHLAVIKKAISEEAPGYSDPEIGSFSDIISQVLKTSYGAEAGSKLLLSHSSKLHYPSISAGPVNLRSTLERLWESCEGAVLVSGTLYLPKSDGTLSPAFAGVKNALKPDRTYLFKPVAGSWVPRCTELFIPDGGDESLCYPGVEDLMVFEAWLKRVSDIVKVAASSAKGGTLVLCASRLDAAKLAVLCADDMKDRLLNPGKRSADSIREEFISKARQGIRPVWFATGPAWTGLDISESSDVPAQEDFLLTDVILTRIPYGLKRHPTHENRCLYMGRKFVEESEALVRTGQGIGRLIRRDLVEFRRLWFLDARPFCIGSGPKIQTWKVFRHLVAPYRNVKHIPRLVLTEAIGDDV